MQSIVICIPVICVVALLYPVAQCAISQSRMIHDSNSDINHQNAGGHLGSNIDEQNNTIVQPNSAIYFHGKHFTLVDKWGSLGPGPGQFNNPAGIDTDENGHRVYIADLG